MTSLELLDPRLRSPAAHTSSQVGGHAQEDDESEWEYEYSTTETETFYVTLDLSKADFKAQEQVKSNTFPSRGSWQTHKASELFLNRRKAADRASRISPTSSPGSSDAEREDDNEGAEAPRDGEGEGEGGDADADADAPDADAEVDDDATSHERVQILDLHSPNPLISYKGRVFSGHWSENITTELLLARHDEKNPLLPVLRDLGHGVDLLAASATRINVTEKILKPRVSDRERGRASASLPATVIPPVDPKASQERIDQRNFLADLIALKRRKGETDDVTVVARSMQGRRGKTKKAKGVQIHRRGRWTHADGRLRAVRGGRRRGAGRRGKWTLFSLEEQPVQDKDKDMADGDASSVHSAGDGGESGISTPTPSRWDDLEEGLGGGSSPVRMGELVEVDMDDDEDGDEDEEDDNQDYDEDEEDDQDEMDVDDDED
ncbi:hypothetical protein F4777DRAFT_503932 [Nemania sp. FL0916]|nr:hypothetical protein F4777DRAFT_503932 [Nemania sp. FL0916]